MTVADIDPGSTFDFPNEARATCPRCGTVKARMSRLFPGDPSAINPKLFVYRCDECGRGAVLEVRNPEPGNANRLLAVRWFPPPSLDPAASEHIPDGSGIDEALQEAVLCNSVGAALGGCLVARRALQLITRQQGAKVKNLAEEIDALNVPDDLKAVAHSIRLIGNVAAHPEPEDWDNVTAADLEQLLGLINELIRYIYERPARIAALAARTKEISGQDPTPA